MRGYSVFQDVLAPLGTHRVTDTPSYNLAAVYVDYRRHVHKTPLHRDVRNIGTPDLVGMRNPYSLQQVRLDKLSETRFSQVLTPVDRMSAHDPEQSPDALGTRYKAHCRQQVHHRFNALGGVFGQVTIHDIHHLDVLGFFRSWLVIHLATVN